MLFPILLRVHRGARIPIGGIAGREPPLHGVYAAHGLEGPSGHEAQIEEWGQQPPSQSNRNAASQHLTELLNTSEHGWDEQAAIAARERTTLLITAPWRVNL